MKYPASTCYQEIHLLGPPRNSPHLLKALGEKDNLSTSGGSDGGVEVDGMGAVKLALGGAVAAVWVQVWVVDSASVIWDNIEAIHTVFLGRSNVPPQGR